MNQEATQVGPISRSVNLVDITSMATFVAVINAASYTEAARRLNMSKSVVSRRISEMEAQLGTRLLDRTSVRLSPTEVGAIYYAKCVQILEKIESANDFVTNSHGDIRGGIRISIPRVYCSTVMAPLLVDFANAFPELRIDVDIEEREASVQDTGFDIALRIGKLADSSMVARTISTSRHWICASPGYLNKRGVPSSTDDLDRHDCLLQLNTDSRPVWCLQIGEQTRLVRVGDRLRSACSMQLLQATKSGLGIGLLPGYLIEESVSAGELVVLLPDVGPAPQPISVVYPASRRASPKIQTLISFIAERIPRPPNWGNVELS